MKEISAEVHKKAIPRSILQWVTPDSSDPWNEKCRSIAACLFFWELIVGFLIWVGTPMGVAFNPVATISVNACIATLMLMVGVRGLLTHHKWQDSIGCVALIVLNCCLLLLIVWVLAHQWQVLIRLERS